MKEYIKKSLYFGLIFNLVGLFEHNIKIFPKKGTVYSVFIDFWTLVIFIGIFLYAFIFIAILFFISKKINNSIYKSKKVIGYIAFITASLDGLMVLLFKHLWINNDVVGIFITIGYFLLAVSLVYFFWKYRIEIASGVFLTNMIYYQTNLISSNDTDLVTRLFNQYYGISHLSDPIKGLILLLMLVVYLTILIFLRKKGIYDYRKKKELWQEKMGEGPYKKDLKIRNLSDCFKVFHKN